MKTIISQFIRATVLVTVALVAFAQEVTAMPASPYPLSVRQPDGTVIEVRLHGDEHCHVMTTADCRRVVRRDVSGRYVECEAFDRAAFEHRLASARRMPGVSSRLLGETFPTHGKQRALAILVEYPETDKHPEGRRFQMGNPRQHFEEMLNKTGYDTDGATGSVREYFHDASNGVLDLTFDVYGPVTLSHDVSYYTETINGESLNAWRMVEEACRMLDGQIDFSNYDQDKNGVIDNVYLFYAGEGGATSAHPEDCIWQHAADIERITGQQFVFDGLRLNHYACSNEYRIVTDASGKEVRQAEGIGTVCHEFSHVLGLPDFYDTGGMGIYTPGAWALMDTGCHLNDSRTPPNYTALERMLLGWLDPAVIAQKPQSLSLRDISHNEAYRISTPAEDEYFLLENRQAKGWDTYLPGHGLLVWHIHYVKDYWDANQVNTRAYDMGIDIVRADGLKGDDTCDGDLFPGTARVTALNDDGFPNMLTREGKRTATPLSRITEAGGIITFDVCKTVSQLDKVEGLTATSVTPTGFVASWDVVSNAAGYLVNVFTRNGGQTAPVGIYHGLNVPSASLQVTGLNPETDYYYTVRAVSGAVSGPVSDEYRVTTLPMTFAYTAPEGVEITEVTDHAFRASWTALADAVDYAVSVYTKESGEPLSTSVDFADGVSVLPDGWVTNSNVTISMKGYYGDGAPALSLLDDYGRLQSPLLPNALCGLKFWYRERSGSGNGYIEISVLDGSNWAEVDRVALPERMAEGAIYSLDAAQLPVGASAVRIVYRRGDKGSLVIDDVVAQYAGPGVDKPLPEWDGKLLGSSVTGVVVDCLQPGVDYGFTVRGVNVSGERSQPSAEARVTPGNTDAIHKVVDEALVSVGADGTVSVAGMGGSSVRAFDAQGRPVGLRLPCHGVYLLRIGSKTCKIIY